MAKVKGTLILFLWSSFIPSGIVVVSTQVEECSIESKNGIVLQISRATADSFVKCWNRTEIEKQERHMALVVGPYEIECLSLSPLEFFFEGDHVRHWGLGAINSGQNMSPLVDIFLTRFFGDNQMNYRLMGGIYQDNTGRYGCRLEHNKSISNSAYLYVSEMSPPFLLMSGSTLDIFAEEDIILLPCKSGNAFSSVNLYKIFENKEKLMVNSKRSLWYDGTKGFYLNASSYNKNELYGQYICRAVSEKSDYINFNLLAPKGVRVTPDSGDISVRPWNSVNLTCTTNKFVGFQWDFTILSSSAVNVTNKTTQGSKLKVLQELFIGTGVLKNISKINISCGSYHTWIVKIDSNGVHPDDLKVELSRSPKPIDCVSPKTIPKLFLISCTNRMQCNFRADCFKRENACASLTKRQGKRCWKPNCSLLTAPPDAGIMNCSIGDTVKILQYYTGFDQIRYAVDSYAPISSILKLNLSEKVDAIYSETNLISTCEAVGFIFSQEIDWAFGLRDGKVVFLEEEVDYNDTKEQDQLELISRTSSIFANSTDIIKLFCFAPFNNSTDQWLNVSIDIKIIESKIPVIINEVAEYVFTVGDTNKNILCSTDASPTAEVTWLKDGKIIEEPLTVLNSDAGVAVLNFPEVLMPHTGNYICRASNFRGTTFQTFTVSVEFSNSTLSYNRKENYRKLMTGLGIGGAFVTFILLFGVGYLYKSLRDSKKLLRELTTAEVDEFHQGIENTPGDPIALPYDQLLYEISMENLDMSTKLLGSGAYGKVFSGELSQNETTTTVAVKTVNVNADVIYFKAILSELKIMIHIGSHPFVIRLIGAYTNEIRKRKILLVMEFCPNGDLLNFLRKNRQDFAVQKTAIADDENNVASEFNEFKLKSWALQIAEGMEYLSSKNIVHGDLAARNILLAIDLSAKITDFGLSKQLYEDMMYMKKKSIPVPWRWMSIEGIKDMIFSSESDMWSYGVLLWEIFSLGEVPYPGINYDQRFIKMLQTGFRNLCPEYSSPKLYKLMERAWSIDPKSRPTFQEMRGLLLLAEIDENDFNYTTL